MRYLSICKNMLPYSINDLQWYNTPTPLLHTHTHTPIKLLRRRRERIKMKNTRDLVKDSFHQKLYTMIFKLEVVEYIYILEVILLFFLILQSKCAEVEESTSMSFPIYFSISITSCPRTCKLRYNLSGSTTGR